MRREICDYKDLEVWQKGMTLARNVYVVTEKMPSAERYGLTSQMRRAAVSIPSNVAEGYGRGSRADYARFVKVARGSAAELETQVILAESLELLHPVDTATLLQLTLSIRQMLNALIRSLESKQS
ncbi:MAG: four helix bundle protein [candidate division WS1 bacterium]|nr:four helix bundle protein [candidate division WS1 bacterium]